DAGDGGKISQLLQQAAARFCFRRHDHHAVGRFDIGDEDTARWWVLNLSKGEVKDGLGVHISWLTLASSDSLSVAWRPTISPCSFSLARLNSSVRLPTISSSSSMRSFACWKSRHFSVKAFASGSTSMLSNGFFKMTRRSD